MANKYWVGGSGNFSDNTNHWADSSGGAAGATIPAGTDNVFFDSASHNASYTVTMDATDQIANMTWTNPSSGSPTFTIDNLINIIGNLVLVSGMTIDGTSNIRMYGDGGGNTVTTNGATIGCTNGIRFNRAGGDWTLQDGLTASIVYLDAGTLNTNGQTVTTSGAFVSNNTATRTLTLGASTINCSSVGMATTTNLTLNANTSTINCTGSFNAGGTVGGGLTFATVNLNGSGTVSGSNTFGTLGSTATAKTLTFTSGTTQTITTWDIDGDASNQITLVSNTPGSAYTISCGAGTVSPSYVDLTDCTGSGGATFNALQSNGCQDKGGNTGWNFGRRQRQTLMGIS